MLLLFGRSAQSTYEADPYNWTFNSGVGDDGGYEAKRRQEGAFIFIHGATIDQVVSRVQQYENELAAKNIPVSHEWGQLYGPTSSDRRGLRKIG